MRDKSVRTGNSGIEALVPAVIGDDRAPEPAGRPESWIRTLQRSLPLPSTGCGCQPRLGLIRQKVTALDSDTRVANLIGSMNEAFRNFRSCSVTPRATLQAPQTYTGILALTTFAMSSGRGGKPTPWTLLATASLTR